MKVETIIVGFLRGDVKVVIFSVWLLSMWLVGCGNLRKAESPNQLHIERSVGADRGYASLLWREISSEDFCQALGCLEVNDQRDQQVMSNLTQAMNVVVDQLNINGIPRPKLVYLHPDNVKNNKFWSAAVEAADGEFSLDATHFYQMRYRESVNIPVEHDQANYRHDRLGFLRITSQGLNYMSKFDAREFAKFVIPSQLLPDDDSVIKVSQLVELFNAVFESHVEFQYDQASHILKVKNKQDNVVELNSDDHREPRIIDISQILRWNARGVVVERRFNQIFYVSHKRPHEVPYDQLLIELLVEIYGYYEMSFLNTVRESWLDHQPRVSVFSGDQQRHIHKGEALFSLSHDEITRIFKSQPYTMVKPEFKLAPELWSLFYFIETYAHLIHKFNSPTSPHRGLFYDSEAAKEIFGLVKATVFWDEFEAEVMKMTMISQPSENRHQLNLSSLLQQTGVFMQIISLAYERIPTLLLRRIEHKLIEFYQNGTAYKDIFATTKTQVSPADILHMFRGSVLSSSLWMDDIGHAVLEWLIDGYGKELSAGLAYFTEAIETRKELSNQRQRMMIEYKAVPEYQDYLRDETLLYYLDLLDEPAALYENYVLKDLSVTEKARCLMALNYEDDLFEFYQMRLFVQDEESSAYICGRVLNLRREYMRHHL